LDLRLGVCVFHPRVEVIGHEPKTRGPSMSTVRLGVLSLAEVDPGVRKTQTQELRSGWKSFTGMSGLHRAVRPNVLRVKVCSELYYWASRS